MRHFFCRMWAKLWAILLNFVIVMDKQPRQHCTAAHAACGQQSHNDQLPRRSHCFPLPPAAASRQPINDAEVGLFCAPKAAHGH